MVNKKNKILIIFLACLSFSCSSLKTGYRYGKIEKVKYIEEIDYDKEIFFGGNDKFGPLNRRIYYFNGMFDRYVSYPVISKYEYYTPNLFRRGIENFFSNFREISTGINQFLQLRFYDGMETTFRFVINTTIGIGGLFDPASKIGLLKHKETFGRTLAYYGVGSGPYLVAPFLGPSNVRDLSSYAINTYGLNEIGAYNYLGMDLTNPYAILLMGLDTKENIGIYFMDTDYVFEYEYFRYLNKKYLDVLDEKNKYYSKGKGR
ncbi:MAG: VacJ family lipoprotein [Fusobacterium sp.]